METYTPLTVEQLKEKMIATSCVVIDIRDENAYADAHIENAMHISVNELDDFIVTANKTEPTIVYCYRGKSSQGAAQYLVSKGFTEVYSLEGGFTAWSQSDN